MKESRKEVIYHLSDALTAAYALKEEMDIEKLLYIINQCKKECEDILGL